MSRVEVIVYGSLVRIVLFIVQVIINILFPKFDDPEIFNPPRALQNKSCDSLVHLLVNGYYKYDAVHHLAVSRYGYIYEKSLAFYPFFARTTAFISTYSPFQFCLSDHYNVLVCALIFNFITFLFCVDRLYLLTCHLYNRKTAIIAVILFSVNPSTIHMTAPYSETLYLALTLYGVYILEKHSYSTSAALILGFSAVTRSNGMINFGFILYHAVWPELQRRRPVSFFRACIGLIPKLLIFMTPFVVHSSRAYDEFCGSKTTPDDYPKHMVDYARSMPRGDCRLPCEGQSPWCHYAIPLSYSYIQQHYWNVGFLRYYTLSKIGCFALAGPVVALTFCVVKDFYGKNPRFCRTFGLAKLEENENPRIFVYVVHIVVLLLMALPFIHMEVITRLLFAASPILYWYSAQLVLRSASVRTDTVFQCAADVLRSKIAVVRYFVAYTLIGTIAFASGLPWT